MNAQVSDARQITDINDALNVATAISDYVYGAWELHSLLDDKQAFDVQQHLMVINQAAGRLVNFLADFKKGVAV